MKILFVIIAALGLITAGCAGHSKANANVDWNSRIGSYSYEQAVAELGHPDGVVQSNTGTSADWILKRSPQMSFGFGIGSSVGGPHGGTGVGVGTSVTPLPHGEYLHLTFGPDGKLTSWSKIKH